MNLVNIFYLCLYKSILWAILDYLSAAYWRHCCRIIWSPCTGTRSRSAILPNAPTRSPATQSGSRCFSTWPGVSGFQCQSRPRCSSIHRVSPVTVTSPSRGVSSFWADTQPRRWYSRYKLYVSMIVPCTCSIPLVLVISAAVEISSVFSRTCKIPLARACTFRFHSDNRCLYRNCLYFSPRITINQSYTAQYPHTIILYDIHTHFRAYFHICTLYK